MTTALLQTNGVLRNYWWVALLQGLASLVLGLMLFLLPAQTLVLLTTFMGVYWLVEGVFKVGGAVSGQQGDRNWWLLLLSGLLGVAGGLFVLAHPLFSTVVTQLVALYVLAGQAFVGGILSIIWAIRVRKQIKGEGWVIAGGILAILYAILLFSAPFASIIALVMVTAILAVIGGITLIVVGLRWRNLPL